MKHLDGKPAAVTGAASGIGLALSHGFAARGMNVVMADINADTLHATARQVRPADGRDVLAVPTDVTKAESVQAFADASHARFGAVHVLCNNAGVLIGGPTYEASLQDWNWLIDVNFRGVIHGIHFFVPRMIAGGQGGHIVNTASMAGHFAAPNNGVYSSTKFAVVGLSESLARDLKGTGIGVSVLSPGQVETPIFTSYRNRPAEYDTGDVREYQRRPSDNVRAPEAVAALAIDAIEADRMYVFLLRDIVNA